LTRVRGILIWALVTIAILVPSGLALSSPLLQWRQPIYIIAGFAGVVGMTLLLLQPLLVRGVLPGFTAMRGRRAHRFVGAALVLTVVVHVVGLWITSPPDVIDALTFTSPTPFSAWGVIAMWAIFGAALLAVLRRRAGIRLGLWRIAHTALAVVIVVGTVIHAVLIEGTMETVSKIGLAGLVVIATGVVIADLRGWIRRVPGR
jgi:predicted ferric reductase